MDDRRRLRGRQPPPQARPQPDELGQVAAARGRELRGPATQLPLEIAVRAAEVGEPHRHEIRAVQPREDVDEGFRQGCRHPARERLELPPFPEHDTVAEVHDVEGRSDDLSSGPQSRPRHRDVGVLQRVEHAVLAVHVVGGGEHVPQRGTAQDPPVAAAPDQVRQVGPSPREQLDAQRTPRRVRQ